jgi:hypothetical protein
LQFTNLPPFIDYIKEIINEFDFSSLHKLTDSSQIGFVRDYISRNPTCKFPFLDSLVYSIDNVGDFAVLEKCEFPVLEAFFLNIKFNERKEYFPFISHRLFPDVKSLAITSSDP